MIHIFLYSESGELIQTQNLSQLKEGLSNKNCRVWVDLENPTDEEREILNAVFHFTPQNLEDVRQLVGVPKIDVYDDYAFLILHRVFYDFSTESCEKREFEVFFSDQFIVTVHDTKLSRTFAIAREKVLERPKKFLGKGTSVILSELLDLTIKDYLPVVEEWQDTLGILEEEVLKGSQTKILDQILQFKKLVATMRKSLIPQKEVIRQLYENSHFPFVIHHPRQLFKAVFDNMNALLHEFETLGDHAASVFEVYATMLTIKLNESSHQLNFVMQRLTIAATIFLPLTFIVGIYGMNFDYMPEFHWKGFYYILWGIMISLTGGMVYFFKRKKWI